MTDFPITNDEFELHPWKVTEVGEYSVDYYVIHDPYEKTSKLYLRVTLNRPVFHAVDQQTAMNEVFKIKNYIIHEGYLDEEMEGTPEDGTVMIYSIYVYQKHNLIKENRLDQFFNWLKGVLYR